jgi:tryptophan synthase alpha chain
VSLRIAERLAQLKSENRAALVPFIMAGDPEVWVTAPLLHALVKAGADVLELGVPFSDPMADGPVIQRAAERALKHHLGLAQVLSMVREFRRKDQTTPVVLMGYLNPIEALGYETFAKDAAEAGVDGALVVDMPPEEAQALRTELRKKKLDTIFLIAPTSDESRIKTIAACASGFVYYVSLRGVTGASHLDFSEVAAKIKEIRRYTGLPLGLGFGIGTPEAAAQAAPLADAVIVGSAIVKRMEELAATPEKILNEVPRFVAELRTAMDRARHASSSVA